MEPRGNPRRDGYWKTILLATATLLALGLLISPYMGLSPTVTAQEQPATTEQAPSTPEQAPPTTEQAPAVPATPAPAPAEEEIGGGFSLNLMLESARAYRVDLDDREEELVLYTFREDVQQVLKKDGFMLLGPRPDDVVRSESAVLVETDRRSVLVGFRSGTDVRGFTLAAVSDATVTSRDGKVNLQHTIALGGSTGLQGATAGPDLLWAAVDRSKERIYYVFDEQLDESALPDPKRFGYYTRNGRMHLGDTAISVEKRVVAIEFNRAEGDNVEDAVRFFVLEESVKDLQGIDNPPRAVGGRTTKPDLTRVRRVTDTMFEYSFDEAVTEVKAEEFTVWTVRGAKYEAASYSRPDARTVRAIFPQLRYVGDKVVMAAVGLEAVKSAESITSRNTIGALRLAPVARANGGTSGPDLTSAEVDVETGLVTYNFDEAIDRRISLDKIDPRNFRIISSAGDQHFGIAVAAIGPNWVSILFDKTDVEDASAAAVKEGAVQDEEGNGNPLGSVLI